MAERGSYGQTPSTFPADELGALSRSDMPHSQTFSHSMHTPPSFPPGSLQIDSFPSSSQHVGPSSPSGGRFATFPVKGRRQDSFAPAIAEPQDSSQSASTFTEDVGHALLNDDDEPAPMYELAVGGHASPLAPPPGAALPVSPRAKLYGSPDSGAYDGLSSYVPPNGGEGEEDIQLPYIDPPQSERRVRFGSRPMEMPRPWPHLEKPGESAPTSTEHSPFPESAQTPQEGSGSPKVPVPQDQFPTPPYAPVELEDEQALNAAAAREVSREMDALMYSPPVVPPRTASPEAQDPAPLSIPLVIDAPPPPFNDTLTHPPSPFARTRNRSPGSPTASRSSAEHHSPTNVTSSPRLPSAPSSPTIQTSLPPPKILLPLSPSLSSNSSVPYRTPPELPANPNPNPSQRTLPQPPVGSSPAKAPPLSPPGNRTISAAAFRRPVPRIGSDTLPGTPDVSPLSIKKRDLRSSPSPYASRSGGLFDSTSSLPTAQAQAPVPAPSQPQGQQQEDDFDYISAYYGSEADNLGGPPMGISETRPRSDSLR